MKIIRGISSIRPEHQHSVATIGNFDGVHLGHKHVLQHLTAQATAIGSSSTLITFEPYPQEVIRPDPAISRLTRFREKLVQVEQCGVEQLLCIHFNQQLASMPAENFIEEILWKQLRVKHLVIGDDFRFGKQRHGDFAMLSSFGQRLGFSVDSAPTFSIDGDRVSSTRVRNALGQGNMELAKTLLGRPFSMSGRVAHGDKRGRTIGFPTANIHLQRKSVPVSGVYAVTLEGLGSTPIPGVANVGNRPTVDGTRSLLEVHLFDFEREIYGEHVCVNFLKHIRSEQKFNGIDALVAQIARDSQQAKQFFNLPVL